MSILGAVQAAAAVFSDFIAITPARQIGGIVADCTVSERAIDTTMVTEHPVEQGAAITDHAYIRPSRVMIEAGWSPSQLSQLGQDGQTYLQNVYNALLSLQAARVPFSVTTGKRSYTNMLFESLDQVTDKTSENVLMIRMDLKQILIVQTQVVTVPDSSVMANPEKTGATQNLGTQQLAPATSYNSGATP